MYFSFFLMTRLSNNLKFSKNLFIVSSTLKIAVDEIEPKTKGFFYNLEYICK